MAHAHSIWSLAQAVIDKAGAAGVMITTAESCTGGMVGAALTDVPGASAVYERGFITYSNDAKAELLGAPRAMIDAFGAVSAEVALAMARGALANSNAQIAVSITGIAGPGGGTADKPVGLVYFGMADTKHEARIERRVFSAGSRDFIRQHATQTALRLLLHGLHGVDAAAP